MGIAPLFLIFELPQGQAGHSIKKRGAIPITYIEISGMESPFFSSGRLVRFEDIFLNSGPLKGIEFFSIDRVVGLSNSKINRKRLYSRHLFY